MGGSNACDGTPLSIKFTTQKFTADLGGKSGADEICSAEFTGYTMCTKDQLYAASNGCFPDRSTYMNNYGWVWGMNFKTNSDYDCAYFTTSEGIGRPGYLRTSDWSIRGGGSDTIWCSAYLSVACCK